MAARTVPKLTAIAENLFGVDTSISILGGSFPVRQTVIRLADRSLMVISPFSPARNDMDGLHATGTVKHIVAPNTHHHLFVDKFAEACPGARLYAAPGLEQKRKDIKWDEVLTSQPPAAWADEVEQHVFQGVKLGEVAFLHKPTRSLILTDMAFNFKRGMVTFPVSLYVSLFNHYKPLSTSLVFKLLVTDKRALRESWERVMAWDFDRVVVGHGEVVHSGGKALLREGAYRAFTQ